MPRHLAPILLLDHPMPALRRAWPASFPAGLVPETFQIVLFMARVAGLDQVCATRTVLQ
jgi:hypothetical protein